ncbi:PTS galactitol transporter subunit IIC [Vagococcus fluvialis]|uniref:PTS galactitol transporter subunit IIC n=1 Tax=Vagococcus fluvialis TaxID=2738 RepID=UPI001432D5A3|nr:PTS transporter subunit IIC [Vagococcus fluvialis]MBO0443003.1 PTS galactitol transporter subunit IIC [Vagococcus fluvialis]MBO0479070.1 PTS galactitol transporter subunit IIC [Vagococcus fluvialis]MBO0483463.1 PTS galactitol transporter subunit IIC [Vagococcus fluvialis]MBO0487358.1 PTS galactitol transporter subunit IIC [Vagococcus fluvialis]MCM2139105.1 PTS galactitol transporter subunit IIC [Vagococcus fluvialis]
MMAVLQWFVDLGASVMLPILLFIFGIILGAPLGKAFKSGLTVGIGFIGLNLVIGLLSDSLGPAAQSMVENFGFSLKTIDVGWPAAAAISYGTALGSLAIPIGLLINVALLVFGLTKTLNVDIWDYWHCAFTGSLVYALTGNFALGLFTIAAHTLIIFFLADLIAPDIAKFYGFPNITFPHGASAPSFLIAKPLNWIFDRIPGFNKLEANPETIQKKLGIFGDSTVMGVLIGLVMGVLAGYNVTETLQLAVQTGAVMMLMPRMVALLMEGLSPISEAASAFVKKKLPERDLYIGMDSALSVGHPAVLSASLLLVPITLLLAVILPGNTVLPFGDLATIPFLICLMTPVFRGNIIRTVVGGTIYMIGGLYIATWVAPLFTSSAMAANFDLAGNTSISSLVDGAVWTTFIFVGLGKVLSWVGIGLIAIVALAGLVYINKIKPKKAGI